MTKKRQEKLTPVEVLDLLKAGNERFVQNVKLLRDLKGQVRKTGSGQYPFAAILGCIDSRVPAEMIFDLGIGDVFNVRVAGNIVNEDVLGSLEYSCKVAGARLILVLGHTRCGAVSAACHRVKLGHITPLLQKIMPAVKAVKTDEDRIEEKDIDEVALQNVRDSMKRIREESPILAEMENEGKIAFAGAMYNVSTGKVKFI